MIAVAAVVVLSALLCGVTILLIDRRPVTDLDRECDRIDRELDEAGL
jgi:hypothetical protein